MRFKAPKGCSAVSVGTHEFEVTKSGYIVDVPEAYLPNLEALGFKPEGKAEARRTTSELTFDDAHSGSPYQGGEK